MRPCQWRWLTLGCLGLIATPALYAAAVPIRGAWVLVGCQPLDSCTLLWEDSRPMHAPPNVVARPRHECANPPCPSGAACNLVTRNDLVNRLKATACECPTNEGNCSAEVLTFLMGPEGPPGKVCPNPNCVTGPQFPCVENEIEFFRTVGAARFIVRSIFCGCRGT